MKLGKYKHFKGAIYEVTGTVFHSETEEEYVLYFNVLVPDKKWIRPIDMFNETIVRDNITIRRFKYLDNEQNKG